MADNRSIWSYIDQDGIQHNAEPVSVQGLEWANGAPATEIKDPNNRDTSQPRTAGWKDETPKGNEFNFDLRRNSLLLSELESKGILAWSAKTNYSVPGIVWASNNLIYFSIQASGPDEVSGVRDPLDNPAYWRRFNTTKTGFKKGLVVNQNVTLPNTMIDFSSGIVNVASGGSTFDIELTLPITKAINFPFIPGDSAGGLFQGAFLNANGYLYAFVLVRDDGLVDAGFDNDPNAFHLPAGYFAYFRAGAMKLDGSKNIVPFIAKEREGSAVEYFPFTMITQNFTGALPVGRQLLTLPIPPGIIPIVSLTAILRTVAAVTTNAVHITPTFQNVRTAGEQNAVLRVNPASQFSVSTFDIAVDSVGQIAWEISLNQNVTFLSFTSRSWLDTRTSF